MASDQSAAYTIKTNIAVLDFGPTILRVTIIDPAFTEEPLSFQKILYI